MYVLNAKNLKTNCAKIVATVRDVVSVKTKKANNVASVTIMVTANKLYLIILSRNK